jgi:predicted MPP superfamily phosphohydrolase
LLPAAVVMMVGMGEARRMIIRRRCRSASPVESVNCGMSLLKPYTTTDLAVIRYEILAPNWPGRRLRVAHLSDLHIDACLPHQYYQAALERANETRPDLIFFTGDFVTHSQYARLLPELLSSARARLATMAVLGNHDYWAGADGVVAALRQAGVTVLGNGFRRMQASDADVLVVGCESPWGENHWQAPPAGPHELRLCMTHTPDNVYRLSGAGMTAIFAGHYHAGQIRAPVLGPMVVPSAFGRRFDHGHFMVNGAHLFVTSGVGSASPPYRIYCQPDIFVVDIVGTGV